MSKVGMAGVGWMRQPCPFHRSARVNGPAPVKFSPNAVQVVDVGQATLVRKMFWPPGGLGVACTCHRVPFHRSARVVTWPELPTAVHADDEVQATPPRKLPGPVNLGVGTICQLLPLHRSASVPTALPELSAVPPTAMQADGEVQATACSVMNGAPPAGLGVGWIRHRVPFHRSARVLPLLVFPTAVHAEADAQETLFRKAPPGGFGVAWIRHRVPFHRSARVVLSALPPTAVQAESDVQDTPFRAPPPAGLGIGRSCQVRPFHHSARAAGARDLLVVCPTVRQADGEAHHALFRKLDAAPGGLGAAWMRQVVPADRSASTAVDPFRSEYPTAVEDAAAGVHATPISRLAAPPPWLGVAWMRPRVPFHRSTRVWKVPERLI